MAKGFSTYHPVNGKEALLRQMVCEVRFNDGQLYLDHCGRLLKGLMKDSGDWIIGPDPSPKGTSVLNIVSGMHLNFSSNAASLTVDQTEATEIISEDEAEVFLQQVEPVLGFVVDELQATEFMRLGFRETYYFSCDSKEESEEWISGLGVLTVAPSVFEAYKAKPEAIGLRLVLEAENCRYRIALDGIERPAQVPVGEMTLNIHKASLHEKQGKALTEALKKKRQRQLDAAFAVKLDIDAFQLEPTEPNIGEFVRERHATNLELFRDALSKEKRK